MSEIAAYIVDRVPMADAGETAAGLRARLLRTSYDCVDAVFVLDARRRLLGAIPIGVLLAADPGACAESLAVADWPVVAATMDREDAATLAIRRETVPLAVCDHAGGFAGAVPASALMRILRDEHLEDLHHMAGILGRSEAARSALEGPPLQRALYRLPWLMVGVVGSIVATAVMSRFEHTLEANIALVLFIPAIVYLADAVGTQSEAVAVRGLSLTDGHLSRLLIGEMATGALIGASLALLASIAVLSVFGDGRLALTVGIALFFASTSATTVGFLLPWLFERTRIDPALGSGPVATVIQDVLSLTVYLVVGGIMFASTVG